jgi:hypothetical protein
MTEPVDPFAPVAPAAPIAPVVRPHRATPLLNVLLAVAAVIAVAGVAFAAGRLTTPASTAAANRGTNGQFGGQFGGPRASGAPGGAFGRGPGGAATIEGTVTAASPTSLTISLPNGQSVTFAIDSLTTYHQQTAGSSSDVATGKQVIVQLTGRGFGPAASRAPGAASPAPSGDLTAGSVTVVTP